MELKEIQELIKLVSKSSISELKIQRDQFSLVIKNKQEVSHAVHYPSQPVIAPPVYLPAVSPPAAVGSSTVDSPPAAASSDESPSTANLTSFKAPMVGTFYRKPGADKDPFVKVGDVIKKGDVLCIIEAMKLFNEIEFDGESGKVVKILVDDSSPVEYDQPLFLLEKA